MSPRLGKIRLFILVMLAFIATFMVALTTVTLWPYEPVEVEEARLIQTTVCPGDPVEVEVLTNTRPEYKVNKLEVESDWRPVGDSGKPESGGTVNLYNVRFTQGFEYITSEAVRDAPKAPGEYVLYTELAAIGTFPEGNWLSGFPKYQFVRYPTLNKLTVEEPTEEQCIADAPSVRRENR